VQHDERSAGTERTAHAPTTPVRQVPGGLLLTRARPDLQVLEARVHRVREDLGLTRRRRELLQAELSGLLKAR